MGLGKPVQALAVLRKSRSEHAIRRGVHTRSHLELGRKSPQRQWYFVFRRGKVGRRQACGRQNLHSQPHPQKPPLQKGTAGFVSWFTPPFCPIHGG